MRPRFAPVLAILAGLVSVVVACAADPPKPKTLCTPNKPVFCRCQDRQQGEKTCAADGNSYGKCVPCETYDNPEGPLEPGDPNPDEQLPPGEKKDSGTTKPTDGGGQVTMPPKCGDGVVQDGEDCDDDNALDTDGCDQDCKLAGTTPQASSSCPGLPVDVWGGSHKPSLLIDTAGGGSHSSESCAAAGSTATSGSVGPDRIFRVTAHKAGELVVTASDANYNVYLYAAPDCSNTTPMKTEACVNKVAGNGGETLRVSVTDGKTYSIVVDGTRTTGSTDTTQGTTKITFAIQ